MLFDKPARSGRLKIYLRQAQVKETASIKLK